MIARPQLTRRGVASGLAALSLWSRSAFAADSDPAGPPSWTTPVASGPGVSYRTFSSRAAGAEVSFHVYLPPDYAAQPERRFPVLCWLHGSGGGLAGIPVLSQLFDQAIRSGAAPPMIILFPHSRGESMWCDAHDGSSPVQTVLMDELLPLADAEFRTTGAAAGRMIEGFSMGGYGAARLGFSRPDMFCAVSMLGAGPMQLNLEEGPEFNRNLRARVMETVYGGDPERFRVLSPWRIAEANAAALGGLAIRSAIGAQDRTLPANRAFNAHLERLGIRHSYTEVAGVGHAAPRLIEGLGDRMWSFYRAAFG
jgi:enterochelin esterase-like enzyme